MAVASDLKAACPHCGGRLAFPREAANQVVACPHCDGDTVLSLTKLMLVVDRTPSAADKPVVPPMSQADTDRPLSPREQKTLFAAWRKQRQAQRAKTRTREQTTL